LEANNQYQDSSNSQESFKFGSSSEELKTLLLKQSLVHIQEYGFTKESVLAAVTTLGLSPSIHSLVQPIDLIEFFIKVNNSKLKDMEATGKTNDVIKQLIVQRVLLTCKVSKHWQSAVQLMTKPENIHKSTQLLYELCDQIWFQAGDRSTDLNFYSKRMLLAGVYTCTELFMTTDDSEGFHLTKEFLERRLDDVGVLGKSIGQVKNTFGFLTSQFCSVLSSKRF
jgi:ubiquinone biosynthesis protein COQ9